MRVFRLVTPIVATMLFAAGPVHAEGKGEINSKIKAAMEAYDSFDYDGAKKQLATAISSAKKSNLAKDPVTAKAYLDLGIVAFAVPDMDAAKAAFVDAVKIDPKIQIDVAYKSPELAKLLETARAEAKKSGGATSEPTLPDDPLGGGGMACSGVKGLEHTIVDSAKAGAPQLIEAMVGTDLKVAKVSVMFRVEGSTDFTEVKLSKQGDCKYTGAIPAAAMKGSLVHYYVAAFNEASKSIASKGSSGSPNIIEISGTAAKHAGPGDDEDPIGGGKKVVVASNGTDSGGEVTVDAGPSTPKGPQKVFIGVTGGTGVGYVTGTTEGMNTVKNCCIGKSLLVITPELGYFVNQKLSIGIAARIGLPLDANLAGHATAAPAGLLRVRYSLAATGEGLRVMGQVGAGFLRNTIKLDATMTTGGDTDIVAQGPFLIGGGIGYSKRLGNTVTFIADLDAIAAIAVVSSVGASPMNSGISADASLGFAIGF